MRIPRVYGGATLLCLVSAASFAQGIPTAQPNMLTIVREQVKIGRAPDHEKFEMGWPAAFEKAKSPYNYIALTSVTGPTEAWYVGTYANNAAIGQSMKEQEGNSVLAAELERLSKGDAEFLSGLSTIHAAARPDLSYGAFPNVALQRFWAVTIFRVRPGHEAGFEAAAKTYAASAKRNAPGTSFRTYQVVAGMPGPVFLVFGSVASFAEFDQTGANGAKIMSSMTPEEGATMQKFASEGMISAESQRFQLNAPMSYVTKETKDQDPAFWMPKKAPAKKAAP